MQESKKTICFVACAGVLGIAALVNAYINQPGGSDAASVVGEAFYPEFTSTEEARSLEVAAVDPDTGSLKRFAVKSDGNLWRIPTHFDYPAEAAARIAQTSASVMGLEKEAIVGMGESEFEKFGVVDPLSDDLEDPETAGRRVTINDENGDALVDYIIGKEIEDNVPTRQGNEFDLEQQTKDFYIRKADDSKTFRVSLDIDLSTRFSDWIDPDLLRVNRAEITKIDINNYKLEERGQGLFGTTQLFKVQGDDLQLNRPSPAEPWALTGLNDESEEVSTDRINDILGVLEEIKIVGVRPKFKFEGKQLLNADLTIADIPELKKNPENANAALQALQQDLMDKGFNFGGTQEQLELVSESGELEFGTSKGLLYRLHIGSAAESQDTTIEIGSEGDDEDQDEESTDQDDANRYMFVRVAFDESLLGDRPEEPILPVKPEEPEGYEAAKPVETKPEETDSADKTEEGAEAEEKTDSEAKPEKEERKPEFIAYEEAISEWESAKSEHEINLTRFKQDVEAFEEKIEEGKELVEELNQRFGDWFYVISASNLSTIQSTREDLVSAKDAPTAPGGPGTMPPVTPDISFPKIDGTPTFDKPEEPKEGSPKEDAAKAEPPEETSKEAKAEESPKEVEPAKTEEATEAESAPAAETVPQGAPTTTEPSVEQPEPTADDVSRESPAAQATTDAEPRPEPDSQ